MANTNKDIVLGVIGNKTGEDVLTAYWKNDNDEKYISSREIKTGWFSFTWRGTDYYSNTLFLTIKDTDKSDRDFYNINNLRFYTDKQLHQTSENLKFVDLLKNPTDIKTLDNFTIEKKTVTLTENDVDKTISGYEIHILTEVASFDTTFVVDLRTSDSGELSNFTVIKNKVLYNKSDLLTINSGSGVVTNCNYHYKTDSENGDILTKYSVADITITAFSGYKFNSSVPYITIGDNIGSYGNVTTELNKSKTVATATIKPSSDATMEYVNIHAIADFVSDIVDFAPFTNVFSMTNDELKELSNVRFYEMSGSGSNVSVEIKDLGDYINKLFKLFCNVQTTTDKTNIVLYNKDTNVKSYGVTSQLSKVDCGKIQIPILDTDFNISSDIAVNIYLPFYGLASLNYDTYKGRTIQLLYIVDVLTGDCTIQLNDVSDGDENPVELDDFNCKLGYNIPYLMANDDKVNADIETNSKCWIDRTPYITIDYIDYNTEKDGTNNEN